jgi:hypothetical protein
MLSPPFMCIINDDRGNYFPPVPVSTSDVEKTSLGMGREIYSENIF